MANQSSMISLLGKIAEYSETLANDPQSTAFVPLCEACREMGLLEDALEIALQGVGRQPRCSSGHVVLGQIYLQRGDLGAALAAFEEAIAVDAGNVAASQGLTQVRELLESRSAIQEMLQMALTAVTGQGETEPPSSVAPEAENPGPAEADTSPGALDAQAPAPGQESPEPFATATLAEIYLKQGLVQRAMKVYRDILQTDPHNETIRQKLVALKRQSEEEARQEGAVSEAPSPPPPAPEPEMSVEERQLAALMQWLDAIGKRRVHVQ